MQLIYNGTDITEAVEVTECNVHDYGGGRSDSIDISLEHPAAWYSWQPKEEDRIEVIQDGYSSGVMYVNMVHPEGDSFRLLATGMKKNTRRKRYLSYENKTLNDIAMTCAAECGMTAKLYGAVNVRYPYIERNDMTAPAFLNWICKMEGRVLKAVNGVFTLIDILTAQSLPAAAVIEVSAEQMGMSYERRKSLLYSAITVKTPFAQATARDSAAGGAVAIVRSDLPARDAATAGRWARGLLLSNNRKAESITIASEFNPGFTGMGRIDIKGDTDAAGAWLVDSVQHDMTGHRSIAELVRVIDTVG